MTDRTYHPTGTFEPVYGCNPETNALQVELKLVSRLADPPVDDGQIGLRLAVDTYEFRYSPPENSRKLSPFHSYGYVAWLFSPKSSISLGYSFEVINMHVI
jgi:hypothetical protein